MRGIGIALLVLGLGSMGLTYTDREFKLLMWIENWGPEAAWGIRIAIAVLGAAVFGLAIFMERQEAARAAAEAPVEEGEGRGADKE